MTQFTDQMVPAGRSAAPSTAVFFGGVVVASPQEEQLAETVGEALGAAGLALLHGGYNGLMEAAARGAATRGGTIRAVTLADKHAEWGDFNPYVTDSAHLPSLGARLDHSLGQADVVVAMGGGVGTLHELTAALYYAGNIRPVPVWVTGPTALRLLDFLREERWLFESPTRPLGFLTPLATAADFTAALTRLTAPAKEAP